MWDATDDWAPYVRAHMEAIGAKYIAHTAAHDSKAAIAKQQLEDPILRLGSMAACLLRRTA